LADELFWQLHLLVGVRIHEHEHVALFEEELKILLLQPHSLHRLRRAEAFVELRAVDEVLQLDLIISGALARLHRLGFDRDPEAIVVLDHIAGANFVAINFHDVRSRVRIRCGWCGGCAGALSSPAGAKYGKSCFSGTGATQPAGPSRLRETDWKKLTGA